MNTEQQLDEAALESGLDDLARKISAGELGGEPDTDVSVDDVVGHDGAEDGDEPDPAVTKARTDGHMSYDEWVSAGKDPRAWRSPEEYNRRGEMLRTAKPELIQKLEDMNRRQEEQAALIAEQIRMAREDRERAFIEGKQAAIAEAREQQEEAFRVGDRNAMREAVEREQSAQRDIDQRQRAPAQDPRLSEWASSAKWYTEGFDANNQPKTPEVEVFMLHQKDYMLRNPSAAVFDSVKYAEEKVKAAMPERFKPRTVQARTTAPAVDSGQRQARPTNDPLSKYSRAEQQQIRAFAKSFDIPLDQYIKQVEGYKP